LCSQNFASTASKRTKQQFSVVEKTCEKTGYKITSWKWIAKNDFYASLCARNISGMRHQIKDRERKSRFFRLQELKNTYHEFATNKTVLATSTADFIFRAARPLRILWDKEIQDKATRRDRAMQIARTEKRNEGGTFKTGTRRSNEQTTQNI
jgi:hypothetical protein